MTSERGLILPIERRDCPHSCNGSINERDDGTRLCTSCFCTVDGEFIDPPEYHDSSVVEEPTWDEQLRDHDGDRERYYHSSTVRLVGGFTEPWSAEHLSRDGSLI